MRRSVPPCGTRRASTASPHAPASAQAGDGGGKLGGGFFEPSERMPNQVINYVWVESIEQSLAKLETLGGKSMSPKIEVPGHGHFMHVVDSEGNLFAFWQ